MHLTRLLRSLLAITLFAASPAWAVDLTIPAASVEEVEHDPQYQKMMSLKGKSRALSEEMKNLRPKAIADVALRVGFQEGYLYRYKKIFQFLHSRETILDSIFNFAPLLLEDGTVMPPVITQADSATEIENPDKMTRTGFSYRILRPARFISVEPSWRDYLLVPEGAIQVERIHPAVLAMNSDEQQIWKENFSEGWFEGMKHADRMFETGVNKLLTDMRGIMQYQMLEKDGYISMPQISRGHFGIRVGDENLEFDQEIFRITEKSKFKGGKK